MAVTVERVAFTIINVEANVPYSVPVQAFIASQVEVYYGSQGEEAILNTDFTVEFNGDFNTFSVTFMPSIVALMDAADDNTVTVRRNTSATSDATAAFASQTRFVAQEFDLIAMRDQEMREQLNRSLTLGPQFEGDTPRLRIDVLAPGRTLIVNAEGTGLEAGPDATDVAGAQANAEVALAQRILAQAARTDAEAAQSAAETARAAAQTARGGAETAQSAAETAQSGAQTARTGAETARGEAQTARTGAQTARTGAEAARDEAITAGSGYPTRTALAGVTVPPARSVIRLNGETADDDTKGGAYARRVSEPAHPSKAQDATGAWFEKVTLDIGLDPLRANVTVPVLGVEVTGYTGGGHSNILIGAERTGKNRSSVLSADGPFQVVSWDRVDAIGNQALKWSRYAERTVAIGSLSSPWLGSNNPVADNHTWFNSDGTGVSPSDPAWDFEGLETRNPGIRAYLRDFNNWATAATDVGRGVAIGRNAGGAHVRDLNFVYIGYRAGGGVFSGEGNVAVGMDAMYQGVRLTQSVALGQAAMRLWQDGTRNTVVGRAAAANVIRGSYSTVVGTFAGEFFTDMDDSVLLGFHAGRNVPGTTMANILAIGNRNKPTLISGKFDTSQVGVNVLPPDLRGNFHVRKGDSGGAVPNGNADALFIEGAGTTGLTIGTPDNAQAQILFADTSGNLQGGLIYTHNGDFLDLRAGNSNRVRITNTGIGFNGNAALAKPTGVAVTVAAIHAVLVNYGLIAA